MFTVPAAIRRVSGPPPVSAPIFTGPVVIPAQTVDTAFSWDMSQYFSGDAVVSYALTNNGGQAWLSINTSTGELSGQTPATPVTVSGVIVTATNTGGSTPTDAFGFEVEADAGYGDDYVVVWAIPSDNYDFKPTILESINATIHWGDGTSDFITSLSDPALTHTYATAGDKEMRVVGSMGRVYYNGQPEMLQLKEVKNWGTNIYYAGNNQKAYEGCANMTCTATDGLNYSSSTQMTSIFEGCTAFNPPDVSNWAFDGLSPQIFFGCTAFNPTGLGSMSFGNTSTFYRAFLSCTSLNDPSISQMDMDTVTNISGMFWNATSLDQPLGDWVIGNVTTAQNFLEDVTLSTANYDATLIGWAAQAPAINNGVIIHFGGSKYSAGAAADARLVLTDTYGWIITDGGPA